MAVNLFSAPALRAAGATSRLAPGDRLTVTVFGQSDLTGVFQVDGEGNIELPLVGTIAVGQLTVKECERQIQAQLANGYFRHPMVNVRIAEPRPIYVLGDVRAPGSFPFRYGGTVLSAVAQAGGYATSELPLSVAAADFLVADERVRTLESSHQMSLIRKARLEAQRDGKTAFQPPRPTAAAELDQQAEAAIAPAIANETEVLQSQARGLEQELELLHDQQPRLETAATAVEKQIAAEKTQFELVKSQLNDLARLQTMGLARRTTEVALQREQSVLDSNISRYRSELARLSVAAGEIDIKIQDTKNAYDRRVLAELQDVRTKLQEIETSLPSAREVRELRLQQAGTATTLESSEALRRIVVSRTVNNQVRTITVAQDALVEPGDVVEVKRLRSREPSKASSLNLPRERAQVSTLIKPAHP